MAYISKFKNDVAYSNTDINEVISAITGSGVLPLSPNDILANVAESGVTLADSRCAVTWANDDLSEINIGPGTVIMPDGSYIIISDEILSVPAKTKHYVYILNDIIHQNIPVCSSSLPDSTQPYVLLAEVENGEITDKRTLAKSKIADYGTRPVVNTTLSWVGAGKVAAGSVIASVDIGAAYSTAIITDESKSFVGIYNLDTGVFDFSFLDGFKTLGSGFASISTPYGTLTPKFINGALNITVGQSYTYTSSVIYTLKLTLF